MQVSNLTLLNSTEAFAAFLKVRLPVKARYGLERAGRKVDAALEAYNAVRKEIVERHAEKDADGKLVEKDGMHPLIDPAAFDKEMLELVALDADVDVKPIPLSHFGETVEPKEGLFALLCWLIDGDA